MALAGKKRWKDSRYFAAAPTREQAKSIFWSDLKAMVPKKWVSRVCETELSILTRFGSELRVIGLDRPERMEGTPWDGGVLDEYANMKPGAWTDNVRPALSDRAGWCWLIGVPEGFNHYRDIAEYARTGKDTDWGFYTWHSADILPAAEIEAAKRTLDPRTFRQEYEATFEGGTGRAYYAYDRAIHEDGAIALNHRLPIILCADFNVSPCVWELLQTDNGKVRVFDEVVLKDTNTVEMARETIRRYNGHKPGVIVYGDAAGSARSTTGKSDYAILGEMGFRNQRILPCNPAVRDRVNAVNSMLRNTRDEARLYHHPRCGYLRKDFETVEWKDGGRELDKANAERTHASDGLGYFISAEFPLTAFRPDPERLYYK